MLHTHLHENSNQILHGVTTPNLVVLCETFWHHWDAGKPEMRPSPHVTVPNWVALGGQGWVN